MAKLLSDMERQLLKEEIKAVLDGDSTYLTMDEVLELFTEYPAWTIKPIVSSMAIKGEIGMLDGALGEANLYYFPANRHDN